MNGWLSRLQINSIYKCNIINIFGKIVWCQFGKSPPITTCRFATFLYKEFSVTSHLGEIIKLICLCCLIPYLQVQTAEADQGTVSKKISQIAVF